MKEDKINIAGTRAVVLADGDRADPIAPTGKDWDSWFDAEGVSDDFMNDREQPEDTAGCPGFQKVKFDPGVLY